MVGFSTPIIDFRHQFDSMYLSDLEGRLVRPFEFLNKGSQFRQRHILCSFDKLFCDMTSHRYHDDLLSLLVL